jgi:S1-C subfamily serine protease
MRRGSIWLNLLFTFCLAASAAGQLGPAQKAPPIPPPQRRPISTAAVASRITPATVSIIAIGPDGDTLGQGSGFLVRSSGVIVTNNHVVTGASRAIIILASGEVYDRVEALDADPAADVAVLKIPGYGLPVAPVSTTIPPVGARVIAIGSPLGLSQTVSEGIVSAIRLVDGRQLVQISAPISPGSSGGPLMNDRGEVVAITTSQMTRGQNLNFAVPVRYAMGLVTASARPRPLAEVFVPDPNDEVIGAPAVGHSSARGPVESPLPDLGGTYFVSQTSTVGVKDRPTVEQVAVLLLARKHNVGLWISRFTKGNEDTVGRMVLPITAAETAPDGRIGLSLAETFSYSGAQTAEGFEATGSWTTDEGVAVNDHLRAERTTLDLTSNAGLYELTSRTLWQNGKASKPSGQPLDWTGEAAVVITRDSIWMDLYLENAKGGNTGAYFHGALPSDGHFALRNEAGKRMTGRVQDGHLHADWTDPRDDGSSFVGTIEGSRK